MSSDKLISPFTNRKIVANLKNAKLIASKMFKEDVPMSWRLVIKKFEKEGHQFAYLTPIVVPEGHKLYNNIVYKPWWDTMEGLEVYCHTEKFCNRFYIEGQKDKADLWMQRMYAQYPSAGYGTSFQVVDENETTAIYVGSQFHSCD